MDAKADTSFGDFVQPFQIEKAGLRGRLVRLGPAVEAAVAGHGYPPAVAGLLAEALAMTAVLASGLKYEGVFSLQVQGDGPVGLMVTDAASDGALRGYARFDAERLATPGPQPAGAVPRLLGAGHMAFTVDQGPNTERYQGITALEGATIGECAHAYFRQSEHLDTAIIVCATEMGASGDGPRAAALMIQRLPGEGPDPDPEGEDDWRRAVILMSSVSTDELLAPGLDANDVLYRLFHEDGVRVYRRRPLHHDCRCSRERVVRTLKAFPEDEIAALAEDGLVTVTCEFCKADYRFDAAALDDLYR